MKKSVVPGVSEHPSKLLTEVTLQSGYQIKALVRSPANSGLQHPELQTIKGDILNPVKVEQTIKAATRNVLFILQKNNMKWQTIHARRTYKTKDDFLRWLKEQHLLKKQGAEEQKAATLQALMVWFDDGGAAD